MLENLNSKELIFISFFSNDFILFISELYFIFCLLTIIFFFLFVNLIIKINTNYLNLIICAAKMSLFFLVISLFLIFKLNELEFVFFYNLLINTKFINYLKILIYIFSILFFIFVIYFFKNEHLIAYEFILITLLSIFGMQLLVMSNDFISFYLALELQSLAFYILASFYRNSNFSTEAGLKYFILGAIASSLFLLGASIIYAITGITNFSELFTFNLFFKYSIINDFYFFNTIFIIGFIMILIAFFFKLGLAPFHIWVPDVYEGISTIVLSFFVLLPKLVFLGILIRFFYFIFDFELFEQYSLLSIFGFLSIFIGGIAGLYQLKLKRLFAYSAIANIGFLVLGLSLFNFEGIFSLFFYLIIYLILNSTFFIILFSLRRYSNNIELKKITELKNLFLVNPAISIILCLTIFSFAGIPPLSGFFIKLFLFFSLLSANFYFISIFSIIISVISAFYYIRLIKIMFFNNKEVSWLFLVPISKSISLLLSVFFLINIFFFFFPEILLLFINEIALSLYI